MSKKSKKLSFKELLDLDIEKAEKKPILDTLVTKMKAFPPTEDAPYGLTATGKIRKKPLKKQVAEAKAKIPLTYEENIEKYKEMAKSYKEAFETFKANDNKYNRDIATKLKTDLEGLAVTLREQKDYKKRVEEDAAEVVRKNIEASRVAEEKRLKDIEDARIVAETKRLKDIEDEKKQSIIDNTKKTPEQIERDLQPPNKITNMYIKESRLRPTFISRFDNEKYERGKNDYSSPLKDYKDLRFFRDKIYIGNEYNSNDGMILFDKENLKRIGRLSLSDETKIHYTEYGKNLFKELQGLGEDPKYIELAKKEKQDALDEEDRKKYDRMRYLFDKRYSNWSDWRTTYSEMNSIPEDATKYGLELKEDMIKWLDLRKQTALIDATESLKEYTRMIANPTKWAGGGDDVSKKGIIKRDQFVKEATEDMANLTKFLDKIATKEELRRADDIRRARYNYEIYDNNNDEVNKNAVKTKYPYALEGDWWINYITKKYNKLIDQFKARNALDDKRGEKDRYGNPVGKYISPKYYYPEQNADGSYKNLAKFKKEQGKRINDYNKTPDGMKEKKEIADYIASLEAKRQEAIRMEEEYDFLPKKARKTDMFYPIDYTAFNPKEFDIEGEGISTGGKLGRDELKGLLDASYDGRAKVGDWTIDKQLSTKTSKVYSKGDRAVVAHRGTEGITDWGNNLAFALGGEYLYKKTDRYKEAEKVQRLAEKKYGAKNVTTIGHSQGGLQAELLGSKSKEIITLNKATHPLIKRHSGNQTDIRSDRDIVSIATKTPTTEIKAESYNPLTEHSPDILNRVSADTEYGSGIKQFSNPIIAKKNAIKYLGKNVIFKISNKKGKKYMVFNPNTNKFIHFGALNYEDFTKHQDPIRQNSYLKRTANMKGDWKDDKYSANNLAREILWR